MRIQDVIKILKTRKDEAILREAKQLVWTINSLLREYETKSEFVKIEFEK